jgi:MYXO-CTERM domain-containing protein
LNGVETQASTCNGLGTCLAAVSNPCEPYLCDALSGVGQCATTCANPADCAAGFGCVNGQCIFGAPRDGGAGDGAPDAPIGVDGALPGDSAAGGSGGKAGAGGAAGTAGAAGGAAGAAGSGGRSGATSTGGFGTAVDAGADAAVDGGPDAGKAKPAAAAAKDESGCGCRVGSSDRSETAAWPLAGLLLLGLRRRRRGLQPSI